MTTTDPAPANRSDPPAATAGATSTLDLLDRSRQSLLLACQSPDTATRHRHAQLAALRAAASVLAARSAPSGAALRTGTAGPRNLWELLPQVHPELAEWAGFFAVVTTRPGPVSARDADDLLRQAEIFLDLVCRSLGLPVQDHGKADLLVPTVPCAIQAVGHEVLP